ncbi:calcium-binding protein [Ascidiaceihabitans sp.]|uniref:calcium-binding protein n=1 Tax=Ascidiaceihabitans sp. TaxID=1872644 RepID=UPI00329A63C0
MEFLRVLQTGTDALDFGVRDLEAHVVDAGTILYASTGFGGGVTSYFLSNSGVVSLIDTALFDLGGFAGQGAEIEVVDGGGTLLVGGISAGKIISYDLSGVGQLGGRAVMDVTGNGSYTALAETDAGHIVTADTSGTGAQLYTQSNSGLTLRHTEADTRSSHTTQVSDVKMVTLAGGTEIMLAASMGDRGISSYRMNGFDPVLADSIGPADGVGIMIPTDMMVMTIGVTSFVLVASMPTNGGSGALTVMQIASNGQLTVTDHMLDSLDMRFGGVQAVDSIEIDGRWFVAAGGGDDGITLFSVLPNGTLQHLDTIADSVEAGLNGVTAITLVYAGGDLQIFAASGAEAGLTQLSYDLAGQGQTRLAVSGGQTLSGTGSQDILAGQNGNDSLYGGGGQDTLMDGGGSDTLRGGSGADVFIIAQDGVRDTIEDFKVNEDFIDLSFWSFLYSVDQLDIVEIEGGVRITHNDEVLDVLKGANGGLNPNQVREKIMLGPTRALPIDYDDSADDTESTAPSSAADILTGTSGVDSLSALEGNDTLYGFSGDDMLVSGYGDDLIWGGSGHDTLRGGRDNDVLNGETGDDFIYGGDGNDSIAGGEGANRMFGQRGDDTVRGADENDTVNGGGGSDALYGNQGNDWFRGGVGDDTMYGGSGNDTLFGNQGDEHMISGDGADRIFGGSGNDTIVPGGGWDYVKGGTGADTFVFASGMDRDLMIGFDRDEDILRLNSNLLDGQTTGWQVVQEFGSIEGNNAVLDFGGGDKIVFFWGRSLDGFANNIEIF